MLKTFTNKMVNEVHAYLLINEVEHKAILIDTAMLADQIISYLNQYQLVLTDIFITHYHVDHITGLDQLQKEFDPMIHIGKNDFDALFDPNKNGTERGLQNNLRKTDNFDLVSGIKDYQINAFDIKANSFGGHTPGITFYKVNNNYVFIGDTLFKNDIGYHNKTYKALQDCDDERFFDSIDYIISEYADLKICPGHHEELFLIDEVKANKNHPYHTMRK